MVKTVKTKIQLLVTNKDKKDRAKYVPLVARMDDEGVEKPNGFSPAITDKKYPFSTQEEAWSQAESWAEHWRESNSLGSSVTTKITADSGGEEKGPWFVYRTDWSRISKVKEILPGR